jgi:asparagine synthase (glutamine-hydrolysing)
VFGGYRRYRAARLAEKWMRLPQSLRRASAALVQGLDAKASSSVLDNISKFFGATAGQKQDVFDAWNNRCVIKACGAKLSAFDEVTALIEDDLARAMMQFDQAVTLPGNQLAMADRCGMAFGLEYRPPILHPEIIAQADSIPTKWHLRGGGKAIWRQVVKPLVPHGYLNAAKVGFNPPIGDWLFKICRLLWGDEDAILASLFGDLELTKAKRRDYWRRAIKGRDFNAALSLWGLLVRHLWQMQVGERSARHRTKSGCDDTGSAR